MRITRSLAVAVAGLVTVSAIVGVGLVLWPVGGGNHSGAPATVTLRTGTAPVPVSPDFWGLNVEVTHRFNQTDGAMVSATPVTYLRFPGGNYADQFNYTSSMLWSLSGNATTVPTSVAAFIATCVAIHCHSILELPGEINSSSTAAYYVTYVEQSLGYHPDYWEIGNEPFGWVHFNVPWSKWATTGGGNATPMQYAHLAHDYIAAIRAVDPTTPIMAPSAGQESHFARAWIDSVLQVNGASVAAISVHSYAAWAGPANPTLSGFFSNLNGTWSLPNVITHDRQYIATDCPGCGTRLFVDEIGAGYGTGSYAVYLPTFNDTLFLAAEVTQGLNIHADSLEWFCFNSGYLGSWETSADHPQSQYYLFSDMLVHLENETLPVNLSGPQGLYAAATTNGSQDAFLLVNTNTTTTASVDLGGLPFAGGSTLVEYRWTNATALPTQSSTMASGTFSLPPLSMVLFSGPSLSGPPTKYAVNFVETGLPGGSSWSVNLSGTLNSSTVSTVGFSVLNGSYSYAVGAPSGWHANPSTGSVTVAGSGQQVSIQFTMGPPSKFGVLFAENGLPGGSQWSVNLSGVTNSSTIAAVGFSVLNGTYAYTVGGPSGWYATPAAGSVNVAGAGQQVDVTFATTTTTAPTVVSFRVSSVDVTLGTMVTFNASVAGGKPPYSYAYTGLPPGCVSENRLSLSCTPGQAGIYTVEFTVTDSAQRAGYDSVQMTVSAPPPPPGPASSPAPWAWLFTPLGFLVLGALAAVGAVGVGVGVRARRRRREEEDRR